MCTGAFCPDQLKLHQKPLIPLLTSLSFCASLWIHRFWPTVSVNWAAPYIEKINYVDIKARSKLARMHCHIITIILWNTYFISFNWYLKTVHSAPLIERVE